MHNITSRYMLREYGGEVAERVVRFAEDALEVLEWMEKRS